MSLFNKYFFLCVQSCLCIHIYRHILYNIYIIYPVVSSDAFFNNILQLLFFHFQIVRVTSHVSCQKRWPLQRLHHVWKEALGVRVV